ncbi:MAG: hypothetical protein Q9198_001628 [Flavoplaca austrocitrina]
MYGSEQMLWICQEDSPSLIGATFKDGGSQHGVSITELKYMRMFLNQSQNISPGFARRNLWIDLVVKYSPMLQTIPDDKIHALRGIAFRYSHLMEDEYVAGLWKSWLLPGLLWKRCEPVVLRQTRQYPSWSWLSIDSAVIMEKADDDVYKTGNLLDIDFIDFKPNVIGGNLDSFGLLPNAVLHLRGHLTRITSPDWKSMKLFKGNLTRSEDSNLIPSGMRFLKPQPARLILDTLELCPSTLVPAGLNGSVWCLPVTRVRIADQKTDAFVGWAVQGLLLEETEIFHRFKRIGWFISDLGEQEFCVTEPLQDLYLV